MPRLPPPPPPPTPTLPFSFFMPFQVRCVASGRFACCSAQRTFLVLQTSTRPPLQTSAHPPLGHAASVGTSESLCAHNLPQVWSTCRAGVVVGRACCLPSLRRRSGPTGGATPPCPPRRSTEWVETPTLQTLPVGAGSPQTRSWVAPRCVAAPWGATLRRTASSRGPPWKKVPSSFRGGSTFQSPSVLINAVHMSETREIRHYRLTAPGLAAAAPRAARHNANRGHSSG